MTKEEYKEYIQKSYDDVLDRVSGWHELANVLKILSDYISDCIDTTEDIYNDKDIDYQSYVELNEMISYKLKEVCRIVKKGQYMSNYNSLNRLCSELNRTLGVTSDIERENLIQSYYNQGLISYRQYYLLLVSVRKHEYINNVFVSMYSENWQVVVMENCFGKVVFLLYDDVMVAKYEILCNENDTCNIDLNLYHPFNRHRTILENIKVNDVYNVVLDYMNMQVFCDTEDRNKMFAFEIVSYFTKQINKEVN